MLGVSMAVTVCLWYGSRLVGAIHPHSQVLMSDLDGGLTSLMVTVSSSDQHTLTNTPPFCDFGVEMGTQKKSSVKESANLSFLARAFYYPGVPQCRQEAQKRDGPGSVFFTIL